MQLGWLYKRDSWLIVLVLLGTMMLAAEIGYRIGRRWPMRAGETSGRYFIAVQGSLLALLALLTLAIKTFMEWRQAREYERAQAEASPAQDAGWSTTEVEIHG